jgi:hypothetical protein
MGTFTNCKFLFPKATRGPEHISFRVLLSTLLHATVYSLLHNFKNGLDFRLGLAKKRRSRIVTQTAMSNYHLLYFFIDSESPLFLPDSYHKQLLSYLFMSKKGQSL